MLGNCVRRSRRCIPLKIANARNWRFVCMTSYWTGVKHLSGLMRFIGTMLGCCADWTRLTFISGLEWDSTNGLRRWRDSLMVLDIGWGCLRE